MEYNKPSNFHFNLGFIVFNFSPLLMKKKCIASYLPKIHKLRVTYQIVWRIFRYRHVCCTPACSTWAPIQEDILTPRVTVQVTEEEWWTAQHSHAVLDHTLRKANTSHTRAAHTRILTDIPWHGRWLDEGEDQVGSSDGSNPRLWDHIDDWGHTMQQ